MLSKATSTQLGLNSFKKCGGRGCLKLMRSCITSTAYHRGASGMESEPTFLLMSGLQET